MELVYAPDPILGEKLNDVDIENLDFDPLRLKKDMAVVMLNNYGVGLSACQVGLKHNLFIMGDKPDNVTLHINPTVVQYTEETTSELEGCLSFPNMYVKVKRPTEILAEYYDEFLKKQTVKITGYSARCYLHELDHMNGVKFTDYVGPLALKIAKEKQQKRIKKHTRMGKK